MNREEKIAAIKNANERTFAENFFDHEEWESQPNVLQLEDCRYKPDFYDAKRNIYIEVIGTRQAFHLNKEKYFQALRMFGKSKFEIRTFKGKLINIPEIAYIKREESACSNAELQIKIEQEAMRLFDELRANRKPKMSVEALANKAFPDVPNARMIIQRMRKPQANGKTRAMSLGEFVKISRALGRSPLDSLGVILNRIEETKL